MLTRGGRSTLFMILLSESVGFYVTGPYLGWSDLIWYDMIWVTWQSWRNEPSFWLYYDQEIWVAKQDSILTMHAFFMAIQYRPDFQTLSSSDWKLEPITMCDMSPFVG